MLPTSGLESSPNNSEKTSAMINQIGSLLIETVFGLIVYLALLRFFMQLFRAPFRNPAGQFVVAFTDWAVQPLRRVVPGWRGFDLSSLALAFLAEFAKIAAIYALVAPAGANLAIGPWLVLSLFDLVRASLHLLVMVVIIDFILSWVNPHTPLAPVLQQITRPFYGFFRRFIPPIGGIDLAPMLVILAVQIVLIVLNNLQARL